MKIEENLISNAYSPHLYFQEKLEEEDFLQLKKLVDDSKGAFKWDDFGRPDVLFIKDKRVEKINWPDDVKFNNLPIKTPIETLWKIKYIEGNLICTSLNELKDLGDLEIISGYMDITFTQIKSLGKLKQVVLNLYCSGLETLEDLGELKEVGGHLYLMRTKVKSLGKLKKVWGDLDCDNLATLEDLGELNEVGGHLSLRGTKIKSLGKLKKVGGNLSCKGLTTLEDIGELEYVGGNMNIEGLSMKCQKEIFMKIIKKELVIRGRLIPGIAMFQMYENGRLNYRKFKEKYGGDISRIEDRKTREIASLFLTIEYEIIKEEIIEEGNRLKEENEGIELTDKKQMELREQVKKIGMRLQKEREKIEYFGIKLDNL